MLVLRMCAIRLTEWVVISVRYASHIGQPQLIVLSPDPAGLHADGPSKKAIFHGNGCTLQRVRLCSSVTSGRITKDISIPMKYRTAVYSEAP